MNGGDSASPGTEYTHHSPPLSGKRKSEDGAPQPRAKRNRYISIACNECKRRKIKCNGQTPCQRCGNLSLECLYAPNCCNNFKDSDEFKRMDAHINSLQEQVDSLFHNLSTLRANVESQSSSTPVEAQHPRPDIHGQWNPLPPQPSSSPTSPGHTRRPMRPPKHPRFRGPTSTAFSLGVAKSSLQTMGITGPGDSLDEEMNAQNGSPAGSPPPPDSNSHVTMDAMHPSKDPIWALSKDEAVRLCHVWQDEMGVMYPILDIERTIRHTNLLFKFLSAMRQSDLSQMQLPGSDTIQDDETVILKMILGIALTLEGSGKSALGKRMFESVYCFVEDQLQNPVEVKGIRMVVLASMYHFMCDDEHLAWRMTGLTARLCVELGLHRHETYENIFRTEEERSAAIKLFWSIYSLDRRWSFGTGMPFAMHEADIDSSLPRPDGSTPYLAAMVSYSNIGSKVWRSVANVDGANNTVNKEDIGYLDYQILQWHRSLPPLLKYTHPHAGHTSAPHGDDSSPPGPNAPASARSAFRLRVILYLRANQMRILVYRPVLHTATSIMANIAHANTVVDVARDTIRVLTHTDRTSPLYRSQQVMFNYFLISALAVLFLAVSHAPAHFSPTCRDEFYMALDLVRQLSATSYVSKRLWRTIRGLKEVGPKLGLKVCRPPLGAAANPATNPPNPNSAASTTTSTTTTITSASTTTTPTPLPAADADARAAADAMAGLAGHRVDDSTPATLYVLSPGHAHAHAQHPYHPHPHPHAHAHAHAHHPHSHSHSHAHTPHAAPSSASATPTGGGGGLNDSPNGMANDLTNLFEAAGAYGGGVGGVGVGGYVGAEVGGEVIGMGGEGGYMGEEELSKIMRGLF